MYLPYGYYKNSSKRYPILYYVHGTGQSAESSMKDMRYKFDNMIADGLIEPMIVVFPTYYTNNAKPVEGASKTEFLNRGYRNCDAFDQEFKYDLMKAVEGKYRSYAKSTSDSDLKASRNYRAITGLSAGGIISWQALIENGEYIKYYIPMSGTITNRFDENDRPLSIEDGYKAAVSKATQLKNSGLDYKIIECCGTQDIRTSTHANDFATGVKNQYAYFSKTPNLFGVGNYKVVWIKNACHENKAWDDGLYNALPQCFPGKKYK